MKNILKFSNLRASNTKFLDPLILLVIWIAIFIAPIFIFQQDYVIDGKRVVIAWKVIFPYFILVAINHFILIPYFLFKNKKAHYWLATLILLLAFNTFLHYLSKPDNENRPYPRHENPQHPPPKHNGPQGGNSAPKPPRGNNLPFPPYVNTIILSILIIGFDTGIRMRVLWSKLEQEKTVLEKENVQNQLAFLRNQISPHFLMNTLNNIHSLIDVNTEEAKEAIIKLSKLMRILLYDSDTDFVPLEKEVDFIKNYISLMKLRFSDKVNINLHVPEKIPNKMIPPYLFTSFVENAFKHGISYRNSSYIDIIFSIAQEYLTFEIKNSIPEIKKDEKASGIGIENSKKRLNILYDDLYSLIIKESKKEYKLTLKIPL